MRDGISIMFAFQTPFAVKQVVDQNQLRSRSSVHLKTPLRPVNNSTWYIEGEIETARHTLERFTTLLKSIGCSVCNDSISIFSSSAFKCLDCHLHVHERCKQRFNIPCIPTLEMSIKTASTSKNGVLLYQQQDFCATNSPMIAWPVVNCVTELEKRGIEQEGLHRVPGEKNIVTNVLNDFRTYRSVPKLELVDIEVICDVIKQFLRELRDPLIPETSREEFIKAAARDDFLQPLTTAVDNLPQSNRDTLACLILHWQRVAEQCQINKMSIKNIARCVALSVMGQRSHKDMNSIIRDINDCERVLQRLLSIDAEYWQCYISPKSAPKDVELSSCRIALTDCTNTPNIPVTAAS